MVFDVRVSGPTAVLRSPVVIAAKAVVPIAMLYSAESVVALGSFPIYIELSSIKASVRSVTLPATPDAPVAPVAP